MKKAAILYCVGLGIAMFSNLPLAAKIWAAPMAIVAFGLSIWVGLEKVSDQIAEHMPTRPLIRP